MKVKIKKVYKDEVEPTLSLEVDINNSDDVKNVTETVNKLLKNVLDESSSIKGIFVSCDK